MTVYTGSSLVGDCRTAVESIATAIWASNPATARASSHLR